MIVNISFNSNFSKAIEFLSRDEFFEATSLSFMDANTNHTLEQNINFTALNETHANNNGSDRKLFYFILYSIVAATIGFGGLIGNSISFLVLHHDKCTPTASLMLRSLALSDNSFIIIWMIHYSLRHALIFGGMSLSDSAPWLLTRVYTFPILYMTQMITIWLTVVIAFNRFLSVCFPYKAPSFCTVYYVYREIIAVVIVSILYNLPKFAEIKIIENPESHKYMAKRTQIGNNEMYRLIYDNIFYHTFTFVIPLFMIITMNSRIIHVYKETKKRKQRMTSRRSANENNITLIMIIVILIFIVCHTPARLVHIILSYKFNHCKEYSYYLIQISNVIEVLNSSVNFIVYILFRKSFRDILCEYIFCSVNSFNKKGNKKRGCFVTEGLSLGQMETTCPTHFSTSVCTQEPAHELEMYVNNDNLLERNMAVQVNQDNDDDEVMIKCLKS